MRVCMRVCVRACVSACVRACVCACVRVCVFALCACVSCFSVNLSLFVCPCVHVSLCVCLCWCLCFCVCMFLFMCVSLSLSLCVSNPKNTCDRLRLKIQGGSTLVSFQTEAVERAFEIARHCLVFQHLRAELSTDSLRCYAHLGLIPHRIPEQIIANPPSCNMQVYSKGPSCRASE